MHQTPAQSVPPSLASVLPARVLKQPSLKQFLCLEMSCGLVQIPEGQGGCMVSGYQCQHHSPAQPECDGEETRDRVHTSGAGDRGMGSATSQNHTLKITPFALYLVVMCPQDEFVCKLI